jgi:uncharacterized protein YigA (DUF484 family)
MSTVKQQEETPFEINEDTIADYLQENPDFFERYSSLLNTLEIPHNTSGVAISLVERQVSALRQRSSKLEDSLRELVEVARGNDELSGKIHAQIIPCWYCSPVMTSILRVHFCVKPVAMIKVSVLLKPSCRPILPGAER